MEMATILLRTVFMYFFILVIYRIMGKREIGKLSVVDLVISIMIAELAVVAIENPRDPLINTIFPMALLPIIQIVMALVSLKSQNLRRLMDGKPSVLIDRGKIDESEMKKQRYNFDDLLSQLRINNISKLQDVEFAILEPSGVLSVVKKDKKNRKQNKNLTMPVPLILDGKVQTDSLEQINKTELWLRQQLKKLGYRDIKQISYCSLDEDNIFYVDEKED